MKVMTIAGTRPELVRLSRIIPLLDQQTEHMLVHTGQNYDYELNGIFFEDMEIRKPDYFLESAGATATETIGQVIIRSDAVLREFAPDAVLILGDTNSCLASISAKRLKIPIFHLEAGNRCYDQRVPEEINRKIIDHISDVNMAYSSIARENLLREGLPADRTFKIGSPMAEVLAYYQPKIAGSDVLSRLGLEEYRYFVISAHREENIDDPAQFTRLIALLRYLGETYAQPVIVSTHPRTRKRMDAEGVVLPSSVQLLKPLGFSDYVRLQLSATAVLSDSGTITEEASILNLRALNIRNAHERQEGVDEGAVMMTGLKLDRIILGLQILETQGRAAERSVRMVADYDAPTVSAKVLRIIVSYTDYVNRIVWKKE